MKSNFIIGLMSLSVAMFVSSCGYERVDAGHEELK